MQVAVRFQDWTAVFLLLPLCPQKKNEEAIMKTRFMSLGSGSSGNCYYLGIDEYGILIDAGVGIRSIKRIFKEHLLSLERVRAVLVTHDHADHIRAVGHLAAKYHIPIYSTQQVHAGMRKSYCMTEKLSAPNIRFIEKEETQRIGDFEVTCFEVPHDGTDNVGYCISIGDKTFSFLTDIGHITETAARYIARANYLILEANYDETMLQTGPYPQHLKARIASATGHLCNAEAARFLATHFPEGLKYVWLCHLSKDNNHPELAFKTVEAALKESGIIVGRDVNVIPLRRTSPSEFYCFE